MAVQILVDSASDFDMEELKEKNIICVPLTITFGEHHYKDCFELKKDKFYEKLLEKKDYPMTSQPSPEDFLKHFQAAKEKGDSVVAILMSSGVSGTCQSANIAKEMVKYDEIHIVDSKTLVTAIRVLVEKALEMREAGKSAAEIAETLEHLKHRVKIYAAIDTLEYLCKGGRVTKAQAGVGDLVRLKPMITLNEQGTVDIWGKSIGTKKAMNQLLAKMEKIELDHAYEFRFAYTHDRENSEKLKELFVDKGFEVKDAKLYDIGSTVGSHTGSGAFGFVCVEAEK